MLSAPIPQENLTPPTTLFLTDRQVAQRNSVSRPTIWRWVKEIKGFPHPIKIAEGTTRWHLEDLKVYELVCKKLPADQPAVTSVSK